MDDIEIEDLGSKVRKLQVRGGAGERRKGTRMRKAVLCLAVTRQVRHSSQMELDLPEAVVRDLLSIAGTPLVVLADDSSSMSSVVDASDIYKPKTRWDELKETLEELLGMLLLIGELTCRKGRFAWCRACKELTEAHCPLPIAGHQDGFVLKFLNSPTWHMLSTVEQVARLFRNKVPRGHTPLRQDLQAVFNGEWMKVGPRREVKEAIVLVLTDGEPTDATFEGLASTVRHRPSRDPAYWVSFLMCTNEVTGQAITCGG